MIRVGTCHSSMKEHSLLEIKPAYSVFSEYNWNTTLNSLVVEKVLGVFRSLLFQLIVKKVGEKMFSKVFIIY